MASIDESRTAKGFTPAAAVPQIFGRARTLDGIVIHHWGLPGQTHDGVVDFFCSTGPGATSAHFVVSAGRINCIVSPLDAAWHSGNAVGNATTIGIECRPEATDADYATTAELIRWLRDEYGDLPLTPHRQWQATACPGVWDLARLDRLARSAPAVTPQGTTNAPKDWFDMATEAQLRKIIREENPWTYKNEALERDDAYALLRAARTFAVKAAAESAATRELVGQLAKGQGTTIDYAKVEAAAKAGAADALADGVDLDATVTVKKAV